MEFENVFQICTVIIIFQKKKNLTLRKVLCCFVAPYRADKNTWHILRVAFFVFCFSLLKMFLDRPPKVTSETI
uniref:Uncharacterized protein n=1 Tax=Anguilla anguilla TaxID=7936 RepID=A0A0E9VL99_ANGAN